MNQLASLLMGMLTPATNAAAGLQPGSAQTTSGTDGSLFQALLMESLGETTQQVGNPESWAGQQLGGVEAADPDTQDESTETTNLLGSISMASSLKGAADVAPTVAVVEPSVVTTAVEPAALDAAPQNTASNRPAVSTTATVSMPANQQDVLAQFTPVDSVEAETLLAEMVTSATQTEAHAATVTTVQQSEQPAVVAQPDQIESSEVHAADTVQTLQSSEVANTAASAATQSLSEVVVVRQNTPASSHKTVEPAKPHHSTAKIHANDLKQTDDTSTVQVDEQVKVERGKQQSTVVANSLPEVQSPITAQTSADYQQLKLKLKIDARVAKDGDVSVKEKFSLHVINTAPKDALQPVKSEKLPSSADYLNAKSSGLENAISVPTIMVDTNVSQNSGRPDGQVGNGLALGISGTQPSMERSVEGAMKSEGFHAPERVIEQKVIHQFVQAAKVQMTDGGANMTLRLDPPHLGVIHMNVTAEQGAVVASIQTSTEAARHALQSDLTSLRQSLADAGITVDTINVSLNSTPDQHGAQYAGMHGEKHGHTSNRHDASSNDVPGNGRDPMVSATRVVQTVSGFDYLA